MVVISGRQGSLYRAASGCPGPVVLPGAGPRVEAGRLPAAIGKGKVVASFRGFAPETPPTHAPGVVMKSPICRLAAVCLLACWRPPGPVAARAELALKPDDYVAIIGDSITEQKLYSVYMEDYLLMCQPTTGLRTTQFGWGGETSWGFAARMDNDMLRFHPTVATTCFGMNDGGYSPMSPDKADHYRDGQTSIVEQCKKAGVRVIVVGSPGCVDSDTFRNDPNMALMYNKTLSEERDIAREVAQSQGVLFADVITPMIEAMTKAKAKYGKDYHLAGGDGVHPAPNGHLVMAYAFLKALGCDGDLGHIDVDLAAGKADGHRRAQGAVVRQGHGRDRKHALSVLLQGGDPAEARADPRRDRILSLQRRSESADAESRPAWATRGPRVTWGSETKQFTAEQLDAGHQPGRRVFGQSRSSSRSARSRQDSRAAGIRNAAGQNPDPRHSRPTRGCCPTKNRPWKRSSSRAWPATKFWPNRPRPSVVPVRHKLTIEQGS